MPITQARVIAILETTETLLNSLSDILEAVHKASTAVRLGQLDATTALEHCARLGASLPGATPRQLVAVAKEIQHFKETKAKNEYSAKRMRELRQGTGKPRGEQPWQIIKARQQGAISPTDRTQADLEHLPPEQVYLPADDPRVEQMMSRALAEIADREMAENLGKHIAIARGEAAGATNAPSELTLADISPATAAALALASANQGRPLEELTAESDLVTRLPKDGDIV